ncbi:MAG: putative glycosyl hydrolase (putative secreted protein) [Acidobacteria bacterium]|nr:putative glycosyl hydrolase (putative secreted protein) [Acidobacteriota bacterium]
MKPTHALAAACVAVSVVAALSGQAPPRKKNVLCIGEVRGWQHESVTYGLANIWKWGQETGLYDTYIRTDCQLITKKKLPGNAKNLDFFDAVVFYTTGELVMDESQKADLLAFVRDDGKGFVGVHSATDTFYKWPEYGEMVGGYFDGHPWNTFKAPILIEDLGSPMTRHFAAREIVVNDEIYQPKDWSRDKVRVLMRLDEDKLDLSKPGVKRADKDWAVTWIKSYGKGRVFYSTLGHTYEAWDDRGVATMYLEGVKWALGLTEAETASHPKPAK